MTTVVWDTWLKPNAVEAGLRLTRKLWSDMRGFERFLSHEILIDQDNPAHVVGIGRWRSREDADRARIKYAESPTTRELTALLARARDRWIMEEHTFFQNENEASIAFGT